MSYYISKSDFKVGSSCAKKLWYKKKRYPTKNDENEYMEYLATGGYIVGKIAQLIFGGGVDLTHLSDWKVAVEETRRLIESNERIIIYEATVFSKGKLARIDVLEKKGNVLRIIEVKAKSQNSDDEKKKIPQPYLEDVLFQVLTTEESYPDYEVQGYLFLPDTAKYNGIEGLAGWFTVEDERPKPCNELDELPARSTHFHIPEITFKYAGHPQEAEYLQQLREQSIFELRNIKQADFDGDWAPMKVAVKNMFERLYEAVMGAEFTGTYTLDKECRKCEFNSDKDGLNGVKECWQKFEGQDTSALDLYYGGSLKHEKSFYINYLIEQGRLSLKDIDPEVIVKEKSPDNLSDRAVRQLMQIRAAHTNEEQVDYEGLARELDAWGEVLYFIDFETFAGAVPFHKGMRPYELIPFQWSCHRLDRRTGELTHGAFLHNGTGYPGFAFAQALMDFVGTDGTPLMWSPHENTTLKKVLEHMEVMGEHNEPLKQWLTQMTSHSKKPVRKGRLVDMCRVCERSYLHPTCNGKASIKKILPAIWQNPDNSFLHEYVAFSKYFEKDAQGFIKNPYKTLKPITSLTGMLDMEEEEVVAEGTGAMKAYFELMYGRGRDNQAKKEEIRQLLLQYCELDTMAMVIIFKYWEHLVVNKQSAHILSQA